MDNFKLSFVFCVAQVKVLHFMSISKMIDTQTGVTEWLVSQARELETQNSSKDFEKFISRFQTSSIQTNSISLSRCSRLPGMPRIYVLEDRGWVLTKKLKPMVG